MRPFLFRVAAVLIVVPAFVVGAASDARSAAELRRYLEFRDRDAARTPARVEGQAILHARRSRAVGTRVREAERRASARREADRYRNLQHRVSRVGDPHRQDPANVDHHRACRRPHSRAHAGGRRSEASASRRTEEVRESRRPRASGSMPGVSHRRTADAAVFVQQQLPDRADQRHRPRARRDDPRREDRSSRRPSARAGAAAIVAGRFDRPMGRRHAGRRHHQLQRRQRLLWRRRRQFRLGPQPAPDRTLSSVRRRHAAVSVRGRQPDRVHAALGKAS